MAKKVKMCNLDEEVIRFVEDKRKSEVGKSPLWSFSAMVNHLLTRLALKDKLKKKV